MSIVSINDIPSLPRLYKLGQLKATLGSKFAPNAAFNEKISTIRQDITKLPVDCIVNAANESLLGGGGVDGVIHRAAGRELLQECRRLDGCDTGDAKITGAYKLPCKKIVHTVGPVYGRSYRGHPAADALRSCYKRSLEVAIHNGMKSIAFSAVSTGVYGYPSRQAAQTVLAEVRAFLEAGKADSLDKIIFCNFTDKDVEAYDELLPEFFPPAGEGSSEEESDQSLGKPATRSSDTSESEQAEKAPSDV